MGVSEAAERGWGRVDDGFGGRSYGWMNAGTDSFLRLVDGLADEAFTEPSLLPDWSRAHVVAHVARNAEALGNLLTWARTGVETPMYPSREKRNADIEESAKQRPTELRADVAAATRRLSEQVNEMPTESWAFRLSDGRGMDRTAAQVPWLRTREVWIHAVDLAAGATFDAVPADLSTELIKDIAAGLSAQPDCPSIRLSASENPSEEIALGGPASTTADTATNTATTKAATKAVDTAGGVTGERAAILGWLSGRADGAGLVSAEGALPKLPGWI